MNRRYIVGILLLAALALAFLVDINSPMVGLPFAPVLLGMTVLAADRETARKEGGIKNYPCGTDIFYKGGMVGVNAAGYAMMFPVAASATGFKFVGVAAEAVDNSAAGTKYINVYTEGVFLFGATSITQAMVGQMMYLVDDNICDDVPGSISIPVGILVEFVSTTSGYIKIDAAVDTEKQPKMNTKNPNFTDLVTKTADHAVLVSESGSVFASATDAVVFTLPATEKGLTYTFVNTGATTAVLLKVAPNASDLIKGGGLAGATDNKYLANTKATMFPYDFVTLLGNGSDGWIITAKQGVWAKEG